MEDFQNCGPWVLQEVVNLLEASYILTVGSTDGFSPRALIESLREMELILTPN